MSPLPDFNFTIPIHCSSSSHGYPTFCDFGAPPISSDAINVPIELPQSYKTGSHHVSTVLILTATLLSFAALLFLALYLLLCRHRRNRNRTRHVVIPVPQLAQNDADSDPDYDQDDQRLEMHHIWLIRTVGLDEAAIKSIPVFQYRTEEKVSDVSDCAVCLTEFRDGEKLRLLPKCSHAFHMTCIDTWLKSHVNCPLCRAPVIAPTKSNSVGFGERSYQDSEETSIGENGDFNGNAGHIMVDPSSSELMLENNLDNSSNGFQMIRRSVSMDSLPLGAVLAENTNKDDVTNCLSFRDERVAKDKGKQGNSAKDVLFQKTIMGMKRSMSSSGGCWFFPTRQGRGPRSYVLPL